MPRSTSPCSASFPRRREFWAAYGDRAEGWKERLPVYQLFPALVHLRLFGTTYAPMVERLLDEAGA
jgi:fructosamine-3-kinase